MLEDPILSKHPEQADQGGQPAPERLSGARGRGAECLVGVRVSLWGEGRVLEPGNKDGCTRVPELFTLNGESRQFHITCMLPQVKNKQKRKGGVRGLGSSQAESRQGRESASPSQPHPGRSV